MLICVLCAAGRGDGMSLWFGESRLREINNDITGVIKDGSHVVALGVVRSSVIAAVVCWGFSFVGHGVVALGVRAACNS